ncbi:MAG TPA: radical SAM/CxCxxxxC motif protein YfkAB [Symbiobacteriaceae bacterium]|nr:radical SAM/CxCxxxxC motif protein YfkAB [Symbiobacteriaceae bacterium]
MHLDLWEPAHSRRHGTHMLTSVEVTVTGRCNLRCRHCAVGETLVLREPERVPLALLFRRLDEVTTLQTLSITGGEPSENLNALREYVLPILRYARERGLQTQVNTNLTMDLDRYRLIAPYTDVLHISWNYTSVEEFHRIVWGRSHREKEIAASAILYRRIIDNARVLAGEGCFVSAESMLNRETAHRLGAMNRFLAELGCRRHEVHPMYPADWAAELSGLMLSLDEYREALDRFLDQRTTDLWVLLGTVPFFACSPDDRDLALLDKAQRAPNLTIRNCPDGRNRLNVNGFTGDIFVTDFADVAALGNLHQDRLEEAFDRWQRHPAFAPFNCYCPEAGCTGPNLLVAQMYHGGVDFRQRRARAFCRSLT